MENKMIESLLLVDDEDLFHLVFEDACSILNIALNLEVMDSSDEVDELFRNYFETGITEGKPECVFVDLKMSNSRYDGIQLVDNINNRYGNGVVIGIISSTAEPEEIERAKLAGAQFWILKSHNIEPRLDRFKMDYPGYKNRTMDFQVYI